MAPSLGFCESTLVFTPIDDFPLPTPTEIQFNIGVTPLTSIINISGALNNGSDIQNKINNNTVFQAYQALNPGATIIATVMCGLLQCELIIVISVPSTIQISELANGTYLSPNIQNSQQSAFVCNIIPTVSRRRKKVKGILPIICINKSYDTNGNITNADRIYVNGRNYIRYEEKENTYCYILSNRLN